MRKRLKPSTRDRNARGERYVLLNPAPNPQSSRPSPADRYKAGERDMAAMQHQVIVEYDQATSPNPSTLNLQP